MTNTMNKTLTALVATSLSLSTLTSTADENEIDKGKKKPSAPKKEQVVGKLRPHMVKFDKNKDGKLCEAERAAAKAAFMKRWDKNKDGKLCAEERKAAMAERKKHTGKGDKPKRGKGKKQSKKPADPKAKKK